MKKRNHCKSVTADRVSEQKYDRGSPVHSSAHQKYTAQKRGNTTGVVLFKMGVANILRAELYTVF